MSSRKLHLEILSDIREALENSEEEAFLDKAKTWIRYLYETVKKMEEGVEKAFYEIENHSLRVSSQILDIRERTESKKETDENKVKYLKYLEGMDEAYEHAAEIILRNVYPYVFPEGGKDDAPLCWD